jgi:DNA-binding MarR family transcriptional regulator
MTDGFTMIKDYLAWKYQDPSLALVYGIVVRFSDMGKKVACYASINTLAERIVYSPALVTKKLKILEAEGYLIDLDSRSIKSSHRRIVTTKLEREEEEYFKFIEKYFKDKDGIKDYYLCFDAFAKENELEPYISLIERVKKPRGRKGYFSRSSSIIDDSIINDRCSNHQPLIILSSTISK